RGLQSEHQVVAWQVDVAGSDAVAVEDGRHLARATGAACSALTELGARLGSDTYLGHDETPWWIITRSDGETRLLRKTAPHQCLRETPAHAWNTRSRRATAAGARASTETAPHTRRSSLQTTGLAEAPRTA